MLKSLLTAGILGLGQLSSVAQTSRPQDDAFGLYVQAAKLIRDNDALNIMAPASSNSVFPPSPPFSTEWVNMERASFAANAPAREIVHEARSMETANWPARHTQGKAPSYLNDCRNIANEVGDAALYQQIQGDNAAAIDSLRDEWHLADLLKNQPGKTLIRLLVGAGLRAHVCQRLQVIASGIVLTKDTADTKDLQTSVARELISQLLQQQDANAEVNDVLRASGETVNAITKPSIDRIIETCNRCNAECALSAMSLACHLYKFDTGNWPKSLDDLHDYLPSVPIDPWGDGRQTLGYLLVRGGLADGSDRPLVYSRDNSTDGLFYRNDLPEYGFYSGDGSKRPWKEQKQGGQFRDVTRWNAAQGRATTGPVEDQVEVPVTVSPK